MADLTRGKTFVPNEQNVDHNDLHQLIDLAVIGVAFHTAKGSTGANPSGATTEIMVYDSGAAVFKRGTLNDVIFNSSAFISGRTPKSIPVLADAVMIADSAAGGAAKQMSIENLIYGAVTHTAIVGEDLMPIFNSAGVILGKTNVAQFIGACAVNTNPVPSGSEFMIREGASIVRRLSLANLINQATALAVPAGTQSIPIYDGAYKKITLAELISGIATALVTPAGTELLQVNDGGTLKKITTANVRAYAHGGGLPKHYILARDEKADTTLAQALTAAGGWQVRELTVLAVDTFGSSALIANRITLLAGTYRFRCAAPGYAVNDHQIRLYNVTLAAVVAVGTSERATPASAVSTTSVVQGRFTIGGNNEFEVQHNVQTNGNGGTPGGHGDGEVYTTAEFWMESP